MQRLAFALAAVGLAAWASGQEFKLGSKVGDFALKDVSGAPVAFEKLKGRVTVIGFIATKCPISNDYNERMKALYADYQGRGVHFVFINPNNTEPAAEVAAHARQNGFPFPVYKDDGNVVADRFGAEFTPEVYVLDQGGRDALSRSHRRLARGGAHQVAAPEEGVGRVAGRPGRGNG